MEHRTLGRTGHQSSIVIFGAFAFSEVSQATADQAMEQVIAAGVNHIDVAPSYGDAELRLKPWMQNHRDDFFLGCKTTERDKEAAARDLRSSLERLGTDRFDLFQIHSVDSMEALDKVTRKGGALEAILEARDEGLLDYVGITGHGLVVADVFMEALRRFPFDTVLFPVSFVLYNNPAYRESAARLLAQCRRENVGVMAIKAVARALWHDRPHTHNTWYQPFDTPERIQPAVNFSLSQPGVTAVINAGDVKVLPLFLRACENFTPMAPEEQETLIESGAQFEPIFSEANPTL